MLFTNNYIIKYLHPYNHQVIINSSIHNHQKNQYHNHQQHLTPQGNGKVSNPHFT